ncbi:uncharacterized protein SOCG_05570 [Schizosaccharomyces octosporus yFS286]|uniref:Uncharacterized protein n=1 Tax=Schizosaccharomyces octosporus (strain yFS286) TaxID=483514 RepID=S9R1X7_SCHOY|nr:uncharacterized protein SOCG_05570 [Schizosaccharomyces octosporus yFS286]EPX72410.1 hypothetical protein SOCG_05570 [Schizosaccharomyces octosporus yFS286]
MFKPRIVVNYWRPEDDSYERINQAIIENNTALFIVNCCTLLVCLVIICLAATKNYHGKVDLVNHLYLASTPLFIVMTTCYFYMRAKSLSSRVPRKERERIEREKRLSKGEPFELPGSDMSGQALPEYTERNEH